MPQNQLERQPAQLIMIREINQSSYTRVDGEFMPNYIKTPSGKKISRVDIIGIIVSIGNEVGFSYIVIDDGSDKISVRDFGNNILTAMKIGDIVRIIGKPREFNNQLYIIPEIVKIIKDERWLQLRKIELGLRKEKREDKKAIEISIEELQEEKMNDIERITQFIREFDKGEGVDIEEVISRSSIKNAETIIENLLKQGEIFEIKAGRVKVI